MSVKTFPDVEGGLRDWLRDQTEITALVSQRVFFGVPMNEAGEPATSFPLITLQRVGGGPQSGEAPLDDAQIQFNCWGNGRNKAQALAVANALVGVLESLTPQAFTDEVYGYGANVTAVLFRPDPADARARYIVTATVTARAA